MLASRAREDFVAASRVLDRLVMSQNLVVPLFYLPEVWVAHARGVAFPARTANFAIPIEALWREPESDAASRALN
jgi:peptide/nickel transport system substrate-binding protein